MNSREIKFAITGANGYVGSSIKRYLRKNQHAVYEMRHDLPRSDLCNEFLIPYSLENEVELSVFENIDVLVHCAYDFRLTKWKDIVNVNVKGSLRLFEAAKRAGVERIIFVSTMSAFQGCKSLYGKAKMEIEREAMKVEAVIVRSGLVFGKNAGGMFGGLGQIVSLSHIVPLVGDGNQVLYLAHEEDLCRLILRVCTEITESIPKPIIAASEKSTTLRRILEVLAHAQGKKVILVPTPWRLIWVGLKASEMLGIPVGFRSDSVVGLVNQDPDPDFELTKHIGIQFREFNSQALIS